MSNEITGVGYETLSLYRRVVYTALLPFMERSELLTALWIWEDDYASVNAEDLQTFIGHLCEGDLANKHNSMLFNINCHLTDRSVKLEEDPYLLMVAHRTGRLNNLPDTVDKSPSQTENMVLLLRQLSSMNSLLEADNRYYTYLVREYVNRILAEYQAGLNIEQVSELRKWMSDKEGQFNYDYSAKQISSVMNLFYVGACEYFGTEKANKYYGLSLKALENIAVPD